MSFPLGSLRLPKRVLVVGQGPIARALTDTLARLAGIGHVVQTPDLEPSLLGYDAVVEACGGITPAFQLAMQALGNGTAFFTGNPLLVAAHGRVLQAAATGQNTTFGWQAAMFAQPMQALLAAQPIESILAAWHGAPNRLVARMGFRNESFLQAKAQLRLLKDDFSDMESKHSAGRLIGLAAGAWNQWLSMADVQRASAEALDLADIKAARAFGLQLVCGVHALNHGGTLAAYAGPMAVHTNHPLLGALGGQAVCHMTYAETDQTTTLVTSDTPDATAANMTHGIVADMRQWLMRTAVPAATPLRMDTPWAAPDTPSYAYVRAQTPCRAALDAMGATLVSQDTDGPFWTAIVATTTPFTKADLPEGSLMLPIAGTWEPPAVTGLRLVA